MDELKEAIDSIADRTQVPPNREMMRLRDMLDAAGIEWHDNTDEIMCRTQLFDGDEMVYSAICGRYAYGNIELWTRNARSCKQDPIGLDTAEEAFALIREEVGK